MQDKDAQEIKDGIKKIDYLLQGNPYNASDSGMIGKLNSIETRVEIIEMQRQRFNWTVKVALAFCTATGTVVGFLLKFILH